MKIAINDYGYIKIDNIVRMHGVVIDFCPFCGKKINLRVWKQ
jgi:hypothetical protein